MHFRAFTFAGVEQDGLLALPCSRRGTATMCVALKAEFPALKASPRQCPSRHGHDDQRNDLLPIHESNIPRSAGCAMREFPDGWSENCSLPVKNAPHSTPFPLYEVVVTGFGRTVRLPAMLVAVAEPFFKKYIESGQR